MILIGHNRPRGRQAKTQLGYLNFVLLPLWEGLACIDWVYNVYNK